MTTKITEAQIEEVKRMWADYGYRFCSVSFTLKDIAKRTKHSIVTVRKILLEKVK